MHVGTFTREGTWDAARAQLDELARLGITLIELMPVGDFGGEFGWGYDGVNWFAPTRLYGRPDALRSFVDRAHQLGMGVVLDVVYNHLGPEGNTSADSLTTTFLAANRPIGGMRSTSMARTRARSANTYSPTRATG